MNKTFIYILINIFIYANFHRAKAQGFSCGASVAQEKLFQSNPKLKHQQSAYDQYVFDFVRENQNTSNRNTIIIPVVFHIVHDHGVENIPDENIYDQMAILNRDYNRLNTDTSAVVNAFKSNIANVGIEFRLAQKDPQGNCTNGIDRIASPLTYLGNDAAKLNPWDRRKYLNVWVVKTMEDGVAGYAYKPVSVSGVNYHIDGIIILADYIGSLAPSSPNTSRALTHEIGHWLNLSHPWGDTNSPEVSCGDDGLQDTPITKGHKDCVPVADFTCDIKTITSATYTFDNVNSSSGSTDPTVPPSQNSGGSVKLSLTNFKAMGVSSNSDTDSTFSFQNWDLGAVDLDTAYSNLSGSMNPLKYYEFSVTPEITQATSLTSLSFSMKRNQTGIRTFVVRSSLDNFTANIPGSILNPDTAYLRIIPTANIFYVEQDAFDSIWTPRINLGNGFANIDKTVTFRVYGYNAEDATGNFSIDNFRVIGTYGTVENVQNFMDYSYCSKMFTDDQKLAMIAALNSDVSFRNNLWTDENLIQTGVLNPTVCAPVADFFATSKYICAGGNVSFKDNSVKSAPTSWQWSFPGGTPSTSNLQNPSVNYPNPGVYPVTLTVSNSAGTSTTTKENYVYISANWSYYNSTYVESFEDIDLSDRWIKINASNNEKKWERVTDIGATGSACLRLSGFYQGEGDVDELISPSYDLRYMSSLNFNFKYLGASKATAQSDMDDSLTVYVSTDCGRNWGTPRLILKRAGLLKAGQTESFYKPISGDTWTTATMNLLASTYAVANVRFKFRYYSGKFTNNFYIDDINIGGVLEVLDVENNGNKLSIFPNPMLDETKVSLNVTQKQNVSIELIDLTGRTVEQIFNGIQLAGNVEYTLERNKLTAGIYLVKAKIGDNELYQKVMIK